ncbi:MAG: hypothetical protein K8S55_00325 [Phycisphaerae bacterium]|nr:hypothetical protein [Phycisphaerae bacterium]
MKPEETQQRRTGQKSRGFTYALVFGLISAVLMLLPYFLVDVFHVIPEAHEDLALIALYIGGFPVIILIKIVSLFGDVFLWPDSYGAEVIIFCFFFSIFAWCFFGLIIGKCVDKIKGR